jgi:hypothetical protein
MSAEHRGSAAKAAFNDCPAKDSRDGAHLAAFVRCSDGMDSPCGSDLIGI